jgi:hypothetical protein
VITLEGNKRVRVRFCGRNVSIVWVGREKQTFTLMMHMILLRNDRQRILRHYKIRH